MMKLTKKEIENISHVIHRILVNRYKEVSPTERDHVIFDDLDSMVIGLQDEIDYESLTKLNILTRNKLSEVLT